METKELWQISDWDVAVPENWYHWHRGNKEETRIAVDGMSRAARPWGSRTEWLNLVRKTEAECSPGVSDLLFWVPSGASQFTGPIFEFGHVATMNVQPNPGEAATVEEWLPKIEAMIDTPRSDTYVVERRNVEVMERDHMVFVRDFQECRRVGASWGEGEGLLYPWCKIYVFVDDCTDFLTFEGLAQQMDIADLFEDAITNMALDTVIELEALPNPSLTV
jgi:hypothetical protein